MSPSVGGLRLRLASQRLLAVKSWNTAASAPVREACSRTALGRRSYLRRTLEPRAMTKRASGSCGSSNDRDRQRRWLSAESIPRWPWRRLDLVASLVSLLIVPLATLDSTHEGGGGKTTASETNGDAPPEESAALDPTLCQTDSKKVRDLVDEVDRLWPIHPDTVPSMAGWIERATRCSPIAAATRQRSPHFVNGRCPTRMRNG